MEDYSNFTKEELEEKINETIESYIEYKKIVSQSYDAMVELSKTYNLLKSELEKR